MFRQALLWTVSWNKSCCLTLSESYIPDPLAPCIYNIICTILPTDNALFETSTQHRMFLSSSISPACESSDYTWLLKNPRHLPFPSRLVHHTLRVTHLSPFADLSAPYVFTQQSAPNCRFHYLVTISQRQSLGLIPHDC